MPDPTDQIWVYLTFEVLDTGHIQEVRATIKGEVAEYAMGDFGGNCVSPEGRAWHRTRWAAQNYACQLRDARLRDLRAEVDRLERLDFGRRR